MVSSIRRVEYPRIEEWIEFFEMDTLARGLLAADSLLSKSDLNKMKNDRYNSFDEGKGSSFEKGLLEFKEIAEMAVNNGEPKQISGKQELFEALVNQHIR